MKSEQIKLGMEPEEYKKEIQDKKEENIIRMKNDIVKEPYLWDMRCWDKYKDKAEIEKWLDNDCDPNNCGHVVYCIEELFKAGTGREEIIELILSNPGIEYKNRLVKCFDDPELCTRLTKAGNYSDCECWRCEGKKVTK